MLDIIKLKKKRIDLNIKNSEGTPVGTSRYYPPATQEWKDSIYAFNKNTSKTMPVANNFIYDILKSYFNMYNVRSERTIKLPHTRKWKRRYKGSRLLISKPELKHCNDSIIINLFIYNRQYSIFLKKLKKLKPVWGFRLKKTVKKVYIKKKNLIVKHKVYYIDWYKKIINKFMKKALKYEKIFNWITSTEFKFLKNIDTSLLNHIFNKSYNRMVTKIFRYQILQLKYRYIMKLNKLKFSDKYLIQIKYLFQRIYNKKIEFNIVSLKNFNFDSNILSQVVVSKLRNRKNNPLKILRECIRKSKIPTFNKHLLKELNRNMLDKQNYIISNMYDKHEYGHDLLNNILKNKLYVPKNNLITKSNELIQYEPIKQYKKNIKHMAFINMVLNSKDIKDIVYKNIVLNSIKNKNLIGIKVQASGRITKRLIAQRSLCKVKYKGSLKDIDSSYKGLSSVIIKGYEKSCLQYTKISNKRRIGAYGVKGWINTI